MPNTMRHVGLDVHAETIAAAVAEADGSVRELRTMRTIGSERNADDESPRGLCWMSRCQRASPSWCKGGRMHTALTWSECARTPLAALC